jgi:hypothetical protein
VFFSIVSGPAVEGKGETPDQNELIALEAAEAEAARLAPHCYKLRAVVAKIYHTHPLGVPGHLIK